MIKGKRKTAVPNENDDEKQQIATETACFCTKIRLRVRRAT